jgi:nucleoside-triphosphatase THEP1
MAKTRSVLKIIDRITGDNPELQGMIAEETIDAQAARIIYEVRARAGPTQQQLAGVNL